MGLRRLGMCEGVRSFRRSQKCAKQRPVGPCLGSGCAKCERAKCHHGCLGRVLGHHRSWASSGFIVLKCGPAAATGCKAAVDRYMLAEASEALPRLATCNLMVGSLVPLEHRFWTRRRVASRAVCTSTPSSTTKLERCTVGLVVQCNRCGSTVLTVAEDYCLDSFPFDCILALRELSLGMITQVRTSD